MNNLNLPNPKMMDVAVPANMHVGLRQEEIARKGWALSAAEAMALRGRTDVVIVDLREKNERERHGDHSRLAACAVSGSAGEHRRGRHAARIGRVDRQADRFLLCFRRALGDGGTSGARCGP